MIFATREYYEPELILMERFVPRGGIVIDAGANLGIYTVVASRLVGNSGTVLSFEPAAESFPVLERNIELNRLHNVRLFRYALSNREGKTRLYHICEMPNSYSLGTDSESREKYEEVVTTTLDKVLQQQGIRSVDFLKMDVEGAEELVLRGAKSLFDRKQPVVVFEINGRAAARLDLSEDGTWKLLADLEYRFFAIGDTSNFKELDAPPSGGNVIAIPRGQI